MTKYHSDDYIKFLKTIKPDNMTEYTKQMQRCKLQALSVLDLGKCMQILKTVIIFVAGLSLRAYGLQNNRNRFQIILTAYGDWL